MNPIPDQELNALECAKSDILSQVDGLMVETSEDCRAAEGLVVKIATTLKSVEERRKFFVGPLNEHVKRINALFKDLTMPLEAGSATVRRVVADFRGKERAAAEEAARVAREAEVKAARDRAMAEALSRKAEELQEQGELFAAKELAAKAEEHAERSVESMAVAVAPRPVAPPTSAVSTRKVWKWAVEDISRVPAQFLRTDDAKITVAVNGGARDIAGITIYCEEIAVVRTR